MTLTDEEYKLLFNEVVSLKAERKRLRSLCARAADALEHESWVSEEQCGLPLQFYELIAELRKAAQ